MDRTLVGSTALMRQARLEDDASRISEFVCGLSAQSRYFRFFASVAPPSSGLLHALCGGTGADVLLVVDGAGAVIAHGMAADTRGGDELASNIGLVVTDRWQQQGLGGLLLTTLVGRAAGRGIRALVIRPAITPHQRTGAWPVPAIMRLPAESGIRRSGETHASGQSAA